MVTSQVIDRMEIGVWDETVKEYVYGASDQTGYDGEENACYQFYSRSKRAYRSRIWVNNSLVGEFPFSVRLQGFQGLQDVIW